MSLCLYYIHDPMCAWCWGFRPAWQKIQAELVEHYPDLTVRYVLGGLAPDSNEPMPLEMRQYIQKNWRRIQSVIPDIEFNDDFWVKCQPRRSTYPACRAVIAAANMSFHSCDKPSDNQGSSQTEAAMILAIQQAYYLHASNPSDDAVLGECAASIGLDREQFLAQLNHPNTQQHLLDDIALYQTLSRSTGAAGFPSLVLDNNGRQMAVPIDYNNPSVSLDFIRLAL